MTLQQSPICPRRARSTKFLSSRARSFSISSQVVKVVAEGVTDGNPDGKLDGLKLGFDV